MVKSTDPDRTSVCLEEKKQMNALIAVTDGSESLETVTLINVLRRGDCAVRVASITGRLDIEGSREIPLRADVHFADVADETFDAIILPGGERGAEALGAHGPLIEKLKEQRLTHRWFGAICAAPALTLAPHGLLDGKQATCYPAFRERLLHWVDRPVVVDGHCITSQGPATAIAFALEWVGQLAGPERRRQVAQAMLAEA